MVGHSKSSLDKILHIFAHGAVVVQELTERPNCSIYLVLQKGFIVGFSSTIAFIRAPGGVTVLAFWCSPVVVCPCGEREGLAGSVGVEGLVCVLDSSAFEFETLLLPTEMSSPELLFRSSVLLVISCLVLVLSCADVVAALGSGGGCFCFSTLELLLFSGASWGVPRRSWWWSHDDVLVFCWFHSLLHYPWLLQ
jgi:hypothetical protein